MKLKIKLEREVVAGLDRGGEDLFLKVRAVTVGPDAEDALQNREYLEEAFETAWYELLANLPASEGDDQEGTLGNDDLWVQEGLLRSRLTHYEFEIRLPLKEAKEKVQKVVFGEGWVKKLKTLEFFVEELVYLAGNAE
jgi:hypothetical protein